ncbi:MAG: 2,3,4,5-tetrahydropyridine-2,6-dicarboxylate N-succinyltransferase [Gammaproteobacteria bacterium]|nr:2,3,4,5-tetrahydropyridine-2,6-dicarboxylate N-succinyltransferase [Gammaproteobacteria bacterium]
MSIHAMAAGVASLNGAGAILDVFYPDIVFEAEVALAERAAGIVGLADDQSWTRLSAASARQLAEALPPLAESLLTIAGGVDSMPSDRAAVFTLLRRDVALENAAEAYLKLHLLSHRLVAPNAQNLQNLFAVLPNVAWTSEGAVDPSELKQRQLQARLRGGHLQVYSIDKFPQLSNYLAPSGVRMADAIRVRLGASLGEGTTVMHEGFVNFNAGAAGPNMIEGRLSQGVTMGAHSDLGGSASTMGTLSGGGTIVNSLGANCLVGANAGMGIPLGDRCTIEAGLYITAGTLVTVLDEDGQVVNTVKARDLAGQSDMLFIRNSVSGRVECRTNRRAIELNEALHKHN